MSLQVGKDKTGNCAGVPTKGQTSLRTMFKLHLTCANLKPLYTNEKSSYAGLFD